MPPVGEALRRWADDLVGARFGRGLPPRGPYGFRGVAGSRTWVTGERENPEYVLLHGLPVDADSWEGVRDLLGAPVLAADLPGLGRSAPARSLDDWTADLLAPVRTRPVLVGHSLGCGPALRYAAARPERVAAVVLVAPAFLQAPSGRLSRRGWPCRCCAGCHENGWAGASAFRRTPSRTCAGRRGAARDRGDAHGSRGEGGAPRAARPDRGPGDDRGRVRGSDRGGQALHGDRGRRAPSSAHAPRGAGPGAASGR